MPRHISILFPGQGSQSLGMLNHHSTDLLKSYEEEVNNLLGFNIIDIINNGDNFDNRTSPIESFEVFNSGVKEVSFGSPSINQIKRLEETSQVTNAESLYLNLWQRNIEMSGNEIMQN